MGPGGQAGSSSKIENYVGFPTGLSGSDLAERAVVQAEKFGATLSTPDEVIGLGSDGGYHVAETLVDDIDRLALVIFGGALFEFCRDEVADAAEFHVPERVGRLVGEHHLAAFEHCPFRNNDD